MMQQMLADRFQLKLHTESRSRTLLKLEVAKGGVKIAEVSPPTPPAKSGVVSMALGDKGGAMRGKMTTMASLADALSVFFPPDTEVVDATGSKAYFDIDVRWAASNPDTASARLGPDGLALLITTLEDRLGLVLKKATGSRQVWVVDRVDLPSPN
jgi:uncharacterized protein (TIGR03435 family)